MASKTDYAWAAGIIDGEGSLQMARFKPGQNRRKAVGFQIRITVRMTHLETITRLHSIFGGKMGHERVRDAIRHKPSYQWYVGDVATVDVIKKILPYMTTKREHAEVLLEYRERCCQKRPRFKGEVKGNPCDDSLVLTEDVLFREDAAVEQKGATVTRQYANAVGELIADEFPRTWALFAEGKK